MKWCSLISAGHGLVRHCPAFTSTDRISTCPLLSLVNIYFMHFWPLNGPLLRSGQFGGQKILGPLEISLEMGHYVVCPQKKISHIFKISSGLLVIMHRRRILCTLQLHLTAGRTSSFMHLLLHPLSMGPETSLVGSSASNHLCTYDLYSPKWHLPIGLMPFHKAQKTLKFQGPTPSHLPNGYAHIQNIMHGAT